VLDDLRAEVLAANLALPAAGLVSLTWGNVSGLDHERGLVVIKPTGVPYDAMGAGDLVVVDLGGTVVEGSLRPSSDTPTHLALYRAHPELGGVVHTHSTHAAAFAQAERPIPLLGTTHADFSPRPVPLARRLRPEEVSGSYEHSTGDILIEAIGSAGTDEVPAVLAPGHGPFCWGASPAHAVERAIILEEVARLALYTLLIEAEAPALDPAVRDKHWSRKHGPGAYYGQAAGGPAP
jgi:L-ribulose-5-phosphate 4-epimerase